ncbi:conjugal transfer protein TraN [Thiobacter aerophilum]|uniref:Conjugal transfer protein TraN n=1 Tax=Thiobacter aerophilum TaxID=3121275 RepID=A0ABV0EGK0_9BURK
MIRTIRLLLPWMLLLANGAFGATCTKTASSCVDTTPAKTISGVTVTLQDVGGCWEVRDTYTCIDDNAINYCQPFIDAQPQCWQTNSQCAQMDTLFNTGCMKYTQTWRCNDPSMPTPANTIRLDDTYTLVSSNYDTSQCQSLSGNPNCSLAESRCVQTTPDSSLPPGIDPAQVAPDGCYKKQETYACLTGRTDSSECDGYASNPNCTLESSQCDPADMVNGQCTFETKTYKCMSAPPKTSTVTDCSGQLFCQDGKCFDKGYENDPDFARSMALMEAAREAGTYMDPNSMELFKGFGSQCKIKLFGLANCCKKSGGGGAYSNNLLFQIGMQVGSEAFSAGSKYVYDALYNNAPELLQQGMSAMFGAPSWSSYSPSFSLYGLTVSTGAIAPGFQIFGQTINFGFDVINLGSFGGFNFAFDPTSFAIQVAIMVIQDLLSCDQDEQILAMRRGQNLCHEVGTYCSKKLPIVKICIEKTKSYCCYNSRLARIINEQGRAQIGKGWGSAEGPSCAGFTQAEFERIDFARIDLSEFMSEVMANIRMPNLQGMTQNVQGVVQQKMQNYYQRGSQ